MRKILLKMNKNITKNICTESRNKEATIKKERVKKIDNQLLVRRDITYGRL